MNLFIKMSFFHYNIAKAIFAINLKGTEYGRSEKSTVLRMILRFLNIAIKVLTFKKVKCHNLHRFLHRTVGCIQIIISIHIECS